MPDQDEFGGIAVQDAPPVGNTDEFGGISLDDSVAPGQPAPFIPQQPSSGFVRRAIADPALAVAKGIISIPEAAIGLLDIPTMGHVGKALELGGYGIQPKVAKDWLSEFESPELKAAHQKVSEAKGFGATVHALLRNPSALSAVILESVPQMLGAAGVGKKVVGAVLPKLAPLMQSVVGGAVGEGLVGAGQSAEQLRQESETGLLTPKQSLLSTTSGAATALISVMGGKLAQRLGIDDIDTLLAGGKSQGAKKGIIQRAIASAINEGAIEELPQSLQEQIQQNIASGKPWDSNVLESGASGMLAGLVMGAVAGAGAPLAKQTQRAPIPPPAPPAIETQQEPPPRLIS